MSFSFKSSLTHHAVSRSYYIKHIRKCGELDGQNINMDFHKVKYQMGLHFVRYHFLILCNIIFVHRAMCMSKGSIIASNLVYLASFFPTWCTQFILRSALSLCRV